MGANYDGSKLNSDLTTSDFTNSYLTYGSRALRTSLKNSTLNTKHWEETLGGFYLAQGDKTVLLLTLGLQIWGLQFWTLHQQRIKLSLAIEAIQVITAPNMLIVDENLRNTSSAIGALCHSHSSRSIPVNFIFSKRHPLPPQQHFGSNAIRAGLPGINFYICFDLL